MSGTGRDKTEPEDVNKSENDAVEAALEILQPATPPAGAAIVMEVDARLHQRSETERELDELVESNEAAEDDAVPGRD